MMKSFSTPNVRSLTGIERYNLNRAQESRDKRKVILDALCDTHGSGATVTRLHYLLGHKPGFTETQIKYQIKSLVQLGLIQNTSEKFKQARYVLTSEGLAHCVAVKEPSSPKKGKKSKKGKSSKSYAVKSIKKPW